MTDPTVETTPPKKAGTRDVFRALGEARVLITLLLGFGSGLPFLLTGATLSIWLAEGDVALSAIGFISWVGLAYSFKFMWAPVVDRFDVPLLGRLGRRRGWMLLSQLVVGGALITMAIIGPDPDYSGFCGRLIQRSYCAKLNVPLAPYFFRIIIG